MQLVLDCFPDRPALDTAVSRAILDRVAAGELPETLRLARPGAMVAFGRQDVVAPGYPQAVAAAREGGFEAVERLAGGRAAVFHERTLAFARAVRADEPGAGIYERFEENAALIAGALSRLGLDARVGEIPGEYCPGAYSLSAGGRRKVMGIGQRLIKRGAHTGGVVVIGDSARVRDVLIPVYVALGLSWRPETAGSLEDELGKLSFEDVRDALIAEFSARHELEEAPLDEETLALAERLEHEHLSPSFEEAVAPS